MSRSEGDVHTPAADRWVRIGIEAILLGMAAAAPWALGGILPEAVLGLHAGLGLVLLLWAARILICRAAIFRADRVLAALGGLALLAALQLVPLPKDVLDVVLPNTLEVNTRLRPDVRERLPGEDGPDVPRPTAFPASLSPPDTRAFFTDLFALTLLYAAARSNLAGPGPLYRLAWVAVVNGALLCALGIAQRVSSPPQAVYWSFPTDGTVFGPFVNRNHLPFYANVCLGLGCGLLTARFRGGPAEVLNRPAALWLLVLVGVTAVGIVASQSRGGVVAGAGAAAGCLAVWARHARGPAGLGWAAVGGLLAVAAGAWLGWAPMTARIGRLDEEQMAGDHRAELWADGLRLFARHPVLGTGGGTFTWVETAARRRTGDEMVSPEYAHNEYVEALAEGGLVRVGLTLWLAAGPAIRVVRRHRRAADRPEAPLLLGGLYGLLAVALQSFVDFGVHLPAVAVLGVILLACLMAASDGRTDRPDPAPRRALAPAAMAAAGLTAAGGLLAWDAWTAQRAENSRWAAAGLSRQGRPTAEQAERAVRLSGAAAAARPGNALYQHELGQAHLAVALTRPDGSAARAAALRSALGHWRAARDLSPVMAPTHARLGRYRNLFERADPALTYFERARSLLPTDPEIGYFCGQARWDVGDTAGACADWRASLAGSDRFLGKILAQARTRLPPDQILADILPDQPDVVFRAAEILFPPGPDAPPARRAFLERARDGLAVRTAGDKTAADWALEARLEAALGRPAEATAAYRRALALSPRQTRWRLDYAALLREAGRLEEAIEELETVVMHEPGNREARDLLDVAKRELRLRGRK